MKKHIIAALLALTLLALAACNGNGYPPTTQPETTRTETTQPATTTRQPPSTLEELEEFAEFIQRAEQVYRDVVLGALFWHRDEASDAYTCPYVWEHVEEAPDLWIEPCETFRYGWTRPRWRVLPSSGFATIAELNAAVHAYWSEAFGVSTNPAVTEAFVYAEIDGALYFFPALASGVGDAFLNVMWDDDQFEIVQQADGQATLRTSVRIMSYGNLYHGILQWEVVGNRIVAREVEWGEAVTE